MYTRCLKTKCRYMLQLKSNKHAFNRRVRCVNYRPTSNRERPVTHLDESWSMPQHIRTCQMTVIGDWCIAGIHLIDMILSGYAVS